MPNFTIFWALTFCLLLLSSIFNPAFGVLAYLFEYYLRPALHWWGYGHLPDLRYNMIAATVLAATYLAKRHSLREIGTAARTPALCLLGLTVVMCLVTMTTAVNTGRSLGRIEDYTKLILFHGLIVGAIRTEWAFDSFIGFHMGGAGWWGWELYTTPKKRTQSRLPGVGSGDTLNDNLAAAHLLTVLPFLFVYLLRSKNMKMRITALLAAPFVINMFILCNSRGAVVGLVAMLATAALLARRGQRIRMVGVGALVCVCFYVLADPEFIARQQSTSRYEEDGSAMERLASWQGGLRLIQDYPFGAGGEGYVELSPVYIPEIVAKNNEKRAPHNTFVLVASEWGLLGLALFLGYYLSVFRLLAQVRRRAEHGDIWYYRSVAIQLSMVGLLVGGLFADRLYAEAPYWMGALGVVLHRLQSHELKQKEGQVPDTAAEPPRSQYTPPVGKATAARSRVRPATEPAS